jgi:prepilin-type processing-associated H-X9-DG protein/prepilin-type N-terminal cleavage/methylation domain-containing protein
MKEKIAMKLLSLRPSRNVTGNFTLIELLVVIAIIAILAGMLIPSLGKAKWKARLITCASNQKQMHIAFVMYTNDFDDFMPGNPSGSKAYYYRQLQSYLNDVAVFTDCRIQNAPGSVMEGYAMDNYRNVAYGASWYTVPRSQYLKVGKITKPGSKILFGDSRTRKQSGSSEDDNPTSIAYKGTYEPDFARHSNYCNFTFADGHVKDLKYRLEGTGSKLDYWAHFIGVGELIDPYKAGYYDNNLLSDI